MEYNIFEEEGLNNKCCENKKVGTLPIDRIIEKLDSFLENRDYESAERHLYYWLDEAKILNDDLDSLIILNEIIGLERKLSNKEKCFNAIDSSLVIIKKFGMSHRINVGTTYINIGTGYKAFGLEVEAINSYNLAKEILEKELDKDDYRLSTLYNNMAVTLVGLNDFSMAYTYFNKSIKILRNIKNHDLEIAIAYLNIVDLIEKESGLNDERIDNYLYLAYKIFIDEEKIDEYYRFVLDKCMPSFEYYNKTEYLISLKEKIGDKK